MIRFNDVREDKPEQQENREADLAEITALKTQADEAKEFWKNEFADASSKDSAEINKMLPEVFNRSEEEFSFSFERNDQIDLQLKELEENWLDMDEYEKEDLIESLVQQLCEDFGIENVPLIGYFDGEPGECGFFDPEEGIICINSIFLQDGSPFAVVETIVHELRHAYQYQRADIGETYNDKLYKLNFDNYITPVILEDGSCLFFFDYCKQLVEIEARAFTNSFMEVYYGREDY